MSGSCEHCGHEWSRHAKRIGGHVRCDCGCMWPEPKPPEPPKPPPTPREQIIARAVTAMYAELECQHENDEIGGAGYWDSEWGRLDGEPDWAKVADAALSVVLDNSDDTLRQLMTEVGWW